MALPLILGLLGSGMAGAGLLGTLSPLIAGSLGAGIGSAVETGDLREGIKTGLLSGLMGGIGGALVGGGTGVLGAQAGQTTGQVAGQTAGQTAAQTAAPVAQGLRGIFQNMPSGFQPGAQMAAGAPFRDVVRQGLNQGVLTGAGVGTALPGAMQAMQPVPFEPEEREPPQRMRLERENLIPGSGYQPGFDPEFYYGGYSYVPYMAGGGTVRYTPAGMGPIRLRAGGIADMAPGAQREIPQVPAMPEMNDKDVVRQSIRAIRGELPESTAAVVLGRFLQTFGEDAFRRLVDDVRSGRAEGTEGDVEGRVRGPGDGMDDLVPAQMDDGSQDVLLSDGEFVVPADVVSGLGNGSTDAGAEELHRMMDRVRQERTGRTEQAPQVRAGGLMPA